MHEIIAAPTGFVKSGASLRHCLLCGGMIPLDSGPLAPNGPLGNGKGTWSESRDDRELRKRRPQGFPVRGRRHVAGSAPPSAAQEYCAYLRLWCAFVASLIVIPSLRCTPPLSRNPVPCRIVHVKVVVDPVIAAQRNGATILSGSSAGPTGSWGRRLMSGCGSTPSRCGTATRRPPTGKCCPATASSRSSPGRQRYRRADPRLRLRAAAPRGHDHVRGRVHLHAAAARQ